MNKVKWLILFLVLFACLGYFREYFFVHYNILLSEIYYHSQSPVPVPRFMDFFRAYSYDSLYYAKYVFTILFSALFVLTNYMAVKKLTYSVTLTKVLVYTYILLILLAGISVAFGYFMNNRQQDLEYTFSRWLMGIVQSPIICLILLASEKLYTKSFPS